MNEVAFILRSSYFIIIPGIDKAEIEKQLSGEEMIPSQ